MIKEAADYLFVQLGVQNTVIMAGILRLMWKYKVDHESHKKDCSGKFDGVGLILKEHKEDIHENKNEITAIKKEQTEIKIKIGIAEKFGQKKESMQKTMQSVVDNRD